MNFCNSVIEPINIGGIRKKRKKGAQKKGGENSPNSPTLNLRLRPGAELQVSGLFLQFMCAPLHVLVVLLCVVVGASSVFGVF